jgi:hypothetical protein
MAARENYTEEELAALLRLSRPILGAMLAGRGGSFFPGAWQERDGSGWRVPSRAVTRYLERRIEPLFTFQEAADFLGVHKVTVQKAAADWTKGDKAGFETVDLLLPGAGAKRVPRITLSELQRHIQAAPRPSAAA